MSNIPKARALLADLVNGGDVSGDAARIIRGAIKLMRRVRRKPVKAKATSRKMTPELKRRIRAYAARHPRMSTQAMAAHFRVNNARISENI